MKLLASLAILKSVDANITCYSCVASRGADGSSLGVSDDRLVFNPYPVGMFELLYDKSSIIQNGFPLGFLQTIFIILILLKNINDNVRYFLGK